MKTPQNTIAVAGDAGNGLDGGLLRAMGLGLGTPLLIVVVLAMMVVPLPAFLLDLLFTFNIALSLIVLLAAVYTVRPLEFAVFPTVLLVATLLRLALNIASTRVVLLHGHTGPDAAGQVIKAFGEFVLGGDYVVGIVVFAILVIINFMVVTKGGGRISEVTARFTLDAMPGKQMAIDADLNAGLLSHEQARARRSDIAREADFYGAMDGASKFVRGDAVAGILILFINIIGGIAVGTMQHHLSMGQAAENYVLLAIGDGLVAQIPALLLSTAAALIVTRVSDAQDMGKQMISQLFASPRAIAVSAGVIAVLGVIPGMPNLVFLLLAAALGGIAYFMLQRDKSAAAPVQPDSLLRPTEQKELSWDDVTPVDVVGLEVGFRLVSLVDRNQGGELLGRIKGVRKKLSQELGFLVQPVHIRDNLDLPPNSYRISLLDVAIGEGEVHTDRELAINPGQVYGTLAGIATRDPAFGLEAVWIEANQRDDAQAKGYTVVDAGTVIATHLSELLKQHAHELLGHDEVQQLLDVLGRASPKLVENLVPKTLPLGTVLKVMQNLLEEGVPVRDVRTIAETLAEQAGKSQDPDALTGRVRVALSRTILQNINGMSSDLEVMALDPQLEQILLDIVQGAVAGRGVEPGLVEQVLRQLSDNTRLQAAAGHPPVLLVSSGLRQWLARLARGANPGLHVLAYDEIPANKRVRVARTVGRGG